MEPEVVPLTLWFSGALVGMFIESCLIYAIVGIKKKIHLRERHERSLEMLANRERRVTRRHKISPEDSEITSRTEETSVESEPVVVEGPLAAAYDPNRLDTIRDTIHRAREDMGIHFPMNDPHVPESEH